MKRLAPFSLCALAVTGFVALALLHSVAQDKPRAPRPQFVAATGSPVAVGPMTQKVLVADLNGDGNPDIVLTCGGTTQGKPDPKKGFVAAILGDGRGGFRLAQPLIPIGADGLKAAVGDLNNDKRPDIVVIAHDSYTVTVLLQDERGRFDADRKRTVQASQGGHPHTHDVAVADVNGDGSLDILTTNEDDCAVSVLLGDGTGGFKPAQGSPFAAGQHPYEGLSLGDLNGDRKLDLVVPNIQGRAVTALLGDGTGGFAPAPGSPLAVGDRPGFVALGDLTGESKLDIVVTHDDDPIVYVLRGDGRGRFRPAAGSPIKLKETVWGAVIADMNADGKNDLVLGAKKGHVLILLGDGAGGFDKDAILVPIGGKGPGNVAVADVNRDGKLDLVTSNYESGDVSVLLQR
jgi:hypothetical protein